MTHMLVASGTSVRAATCGHAVDAGRRVLEVLDDAGQPVGHGDGRLRRPGAVGVQPQRQVGERVAQRLDRGALLVGRQHPALELERAEAPAVDHPPGLRDELRPGSSASPHVVARRPGWPAHL